MLALQLNFDAIVSCNSVVASAMVIYPKKSMARGGIVIHSDILSGEHKNRSAFFAEVVRFSKHGFFLEEGLDEALEGPDFLLQGVDRQCHRFCHR